MKPAVGLLVVVGLSGLTGCSVFQAAPSVRSTVAPPAPRQSISTPLADSERPNTRIIPMAVEGEVLEMELTLFGQPSLPFTTYVPSTDFQSEVSTGAEAMSAYFYFSPSGKKDSNAYLQIVMPQDRMSVAQMQDALLSNQGLLAKNGWELVDRTEIVSYPWAKEKLIYQKRTANQLFVGSIYIGEYEGGAFYTLTYYPAEYVDGFEPRSTVLLENLQFQD